MTSQTFSSPADPAAQRPIEAETAPTPHSNELANELERLEQEERIERDRRRQEELARLRELARYD